MSFTYGCSPKSLLRHSRRPSTPFLDPVRVFPPSIRSPPQQRPRDELRAGGNIIYVYFLHPVRGYKTSRSGSILRHLYGVEY